MVNSDLIKCSGPEALCLVDMFQQNIFWDFNSTLFSYY